MLRLVLFVRSSLDSIHRMIFCGLCMGLLASPLPAQGYLLSTMGTARYTIVQDKTATASERMAAQELAWHLQRISGAPFRIVDEGNAPPQYRIIVGPGRLSRTLVAPKILDSLGSEEFIIRTVGTDLVLVGGPPRGTLYSVYSFLENDLGVQWLTWWGDENVPHQSELRITHIDRRDKPSFDIRDVVTHTNNYVNKDALRRFLVRNRDQGPELALTGDLSQYGGTSHRYGGPIIHTSFKLIPPAGYFKDHPDYFSLIKGKRVPNQLCFSNSGLRKVLTDKVIQLIKDNGGVGNFSITAQDSQGPFCEDPKCASLVQRENTPGAPIFDYLLELANIIKPLFPRANLTTLAYRKEQAEKPPTFIKFPDNVIVLFAPIDDNFAVSLSHPNNQETLKNLKNWKQHCSHIWVWYYPNPYSTPLPLGNFARVLQDFRIFKSEGIEGLFIEQDADVYDSQRMSDLQTWILLKLMWNPNENLESLITKFTDSFYGPAAPTIRTYLANLEQFTASMGTRLAWNASIWQYRYLTPERLAHFQTMFDAAELASAPNPTALRHVRQARMSLDRADVLLGSASNPKRPEMIRRLQQTYNETITSQVVPKEQPALLQSIENFVNWRNAMTPIKSLPHPLNNIPTTRIHQFTPENAWISPGGGNLMLDPEAATGIAAAMKISDRFPCNLGFYDETTKRQQNIYPGKTEPIQAGRYHLYHIGMTKLSESCLIWLDWSWQIKFDAISTLFDPSNPDKMWDIYVSAKFEPQANSSDNTKGSFSGLKVDRVILVE